MTNDDRARKALDEIANGMQSVTALSTELRRTLGGNAEKEEAEAHGRDPHRAPPRDPGKLKRKVA